MAVVMERIDVGGKAKSNDKAKLIHPELVNGSKIS